MEDHKRNPNTTCDSCSKPIYRRPNEIRKRNVYCSQACYGVGNRKFVDCVVCKTPISKSLNKKTCGKICAKQYFSERIKTRRPRGRKFGGENAKGWRVNRSDSRSLRRYAILEKGIVCEECGYNNLNILHVHHIVERCKGGGDELENLKILCPNCHETTHKGDSRIEPNGESKRILKYLSEGYESTK